jgi:hypothetical protein
VPGAELFTSGPRGLTRPQSQEKEGDCERSFALDFDFSIEFQYVTNFAYFLRNEVKEPDLLGANRDKSYLSTELSTDSVDIWTYRPPTLGT